MTTRKITVRKSFCPDVHFDVDFFGVNPLNATPEKRLEKVLDYWRMITGMSWQLMPKRDLCDDTYEGFEVVNPMDNQGRVTFYWEVVR